MEYVKYDGWVVIGRKRRRRMDSESSRRQPVQSPDRGLETATDTESFGSPLGAELGLAMVA